jgi:hypothetical protein
MGGRVGPGDTRVGKKKMKKSQEREVPEAQDE